MNLRRIGRQDLFDECGIGGPNAIGCQQLRRNPARSPIAQADQDAPVLEISQTLNGKIAAREDPNRFIEHASDRQPFAKLLLPPLFGLLTGEASLQAADEATLDEPCVHSGLVIDERLERGKALGGVAKLQADAI